MAQTLALTEDVIRALESEVKLPSQSNTFKADYRKADLESLMARCDDFKARISRLLAIYN